MALGLGYNPQIARGLRSGWGTRLSNPLPTLGMPGPITGPMPLTQTLPTLGLEPLNRLPQVAAQGEGAAARGLGTLFRGPSGPSGLPRINMAELMGPKPPTLGTMMRGPAAPSLPFSLQAQLTQPGLPYGPAGPASAYPAQLSGVGPLGQPYGTNAIYNPTPGVNPANIAGKFPAPPAAPTPIPTQTAGQMARGALSGMSGSFLPGATGLKGTGANLLAAMGIQYLGNAATQGLGGQDTTAGRLMGSATRGAGMGAIGGPKFAAALGATNVSMQAGAEKRRAFDEGGIGGVLDQMNPDSISEVPGAALDAALLPLTAPLQAVGGIIGGDLGKLPGIGGLFGGGGDEQAVEVSEEDRARAKAEAANKYTPSNIYSTAFAMGIPARDIEPIIQQFKSQVAYMKASPKQDARVFDPATGQLDQASTDESIQMLKDAGYDVAEDGSFIADDAFINQQAWNQAYQSLPQVQQQSIQTADYSRRVAAMQAELARRLPEMTARMSPEMAAAVGAQLTAMPGIMAQKESDDRIMGNLRQIQQYRDQAAMQAAGLLPSSQQSSSDADAITAALVP